MNISEFSYDISGTSLSTDLTEAGDVYLMCPECYSIYRATISHISKFNIVTKDKRLLAEGSQVKERFILIDCLNCHSLNLNAIELDVHIAECISLLNKKGYITKYCCEGEETSAYVVMYGIYPEIRELTNHSIYWELDTDYTKDTTIRCSKMIEDRSIYHKMLHIAELYDLVQKLPDKSSNKEEENINE